MPVNEDLPEGWEAGIGERSDGNYYDKWFYHPEKDLELHVWWESEERSGNKNHVLLLEKVTERDENGDPSSRKQIKRGRVSGETMTEGEDKASEKAKSWMKKINGGELK